MMQLFEKISYLAILVGVLLLYIPDSMGLYEDEAGRFDWRHQYTGKPKHLLFDTDGQTGKRVVTATEKNVLASLNARNGQILWRQVFERGDTGRVDDIILSGNMILAVLGGGTYVRAFATSTGDLEWESNIDGVNAQHRARMIMTGGKLVVLAGARVVMLSKYSGDIEWTVTLQNSDTTEYMTIQSLQEKNLHIVGMVPNSHITVVTVSEDNGEQISSVSVPAGWVTKATECRMVAMQYFVCLDTGSEVIQMLDLENPQMFRAVLPQSYDLPGKHMSFIATADAPGPQFLVRFSPSRVAGFVVKDGSVALVKDFKGVSAATIVSHGEGYVWMTVNKIAQNTLEISGHDLENGEVVSDLSITTTFYDHHGYPTELYATHFKKRDGASAIKMMIVSEDHSIVMLQQSGKLSWTREESLASIVSTEIVDLPVSPILAKMDEEFGSHTHDILSMFIRRFTTQFLQLKEFLLSLRSALLLPKHHHHGNVEADAAVTKTGDQEDDEQYLTRDEFDLHKMIVVATEAGKGYNVNTFAYPSLGTVVYFATRPFVLWVKVEGERKEELFGLDSETGMPEWKHFLPGVKPFDRFGKQSLPLYVQTTTAHFPHTPRCVVLGQQQVTGHGHLYTFNPITGEPVEGMPSGGETLGFFLRQATMLSQMNEEFVRPVLMLDTNLKIHIIVTLAFFLRQATMLSQMNEEFVRPVLMLDTNLKYHVYPSNSEALVRTLAPSIYMFSADIDTSTISGYNVKVHDNTLVAQELWLVTLGYDSHRITNVVAKRPQEHVHSQGVVLGDRGVLYKYINPNLVVVTTEEDKAEDDPQAKGGLNVFFLDVITGHIVFQCSHKRTKSPVNVVHSENWMIYSYYNTKHRRNEVNVVELYEGHKQSNATTFSSLSPPPPPIVMRQSYIINAHVTAMQATITEKGITSKQIMIAMETGGVLGMPRLFLDARRPINPTLETREEGLMPYIPEIPRAPEMTVNYHQSVERIHGIHTAPAGLESTSLVLCYGLGGYENPIYHQSVERIHGIHTAPAGLESTSLVLCYGLGGYENPIYHQSVERIHGIHTAPAGLESTSLVLCYGLDLFYTRVNPSKMFDVLKEDFDYFFISCVLIGMISVSAISRKLAQRKALNKAWK